MCVCERERERERGGGEGGRERERERGGRGGGRWGARSLCAFMRMCMRKRGRWGRDIERKEGRSVEREGGDGTCAGARALIMCVYAYVYEEERTVGKRQTRGWGRSGVGGRRGVVKRLSPENTKWPIGSTDPF